MLTSIARRPGTLFYVPGIETIPTTHPDVVSQQEDEQEEPVIFVKREAMKRNVDDGRTDEQKQDTSKRDNIRARESAQKSPGKQPEAQTGVIDEKRRIDSANVDAFQGSPRDQDQRDEVVPEDSTKLTADQLERLRLSIDIHDLYKYKDHRRQAKCDDSSNIVSFVKHRFIVVSKVCSLTFVPKFKKHRRPANCDEDTEEGTRLMIEDLERLRMSNDIHDLYKFKNNHRPANCSIQEDNLGSGGDELGANVAGNQAHEKVIRGHQPVQRDDNSKTDELGRGVNSKRRRIYAANVDAKLWNVKFPYDKIADNQRDRNATEVKYVFGMETSL
ncbi:hypothetical protein THAOC_08437 [Thalassiosira oceanica]|uniref:Uncharacterized protein n=1 Tax=Thalassiosira oceanica TaxID=159749 RepID=K0TA30_THAOC|nr:hypothetical protein THAOC_08437 [Thalassiosira oceanica]|eukprot:EJK70221.1 hypothetical protein THAOC_08437 [Thalassiosira oceanica]